MKTRTTKFMTLMTVAALGIFSAGTVRAAGNKDVYKRQDTTWKVQQTSQEP